MHRVPGKLLAERDFTRPQTTSPSPQRCIHENTSLWRTVLPTTQRHLNHGRSVDCQVLGRNTRLRAPRLLATSPGHVCSADGTRTGRQLPRLRLRLFTPKHAYTSPTLDGGRFVIVERSHEAQLWGSAWEWHTKHSQADTHHTRDTGVVEERDGSKTPFALVSRLVMRVRRSHVVPVRCRRVCVCVCANGCVCVCVC